MKLTYTLIGSALISMSSFVAASDGGQASVPVTVQFTGQDQCVPGSVPAQSMNISAADIAAITNLPASVTKPVIKTQTMQIPIVNCRAGTSFTLIPQSSFSFGGVTPIFATGLPNNITGQGTTVEGWNFSGAANDALALALASKMNQFSGFQYISTTTGKTTSVLADDILEINYAVFASNLEKARNLKTGSYSATALINVVF